MIIIVLIIVKMIVEWSPFFQTFSDLAILLQIFAINLSDWNFTLSIEIKEFMFNCLAENLFL